jgi:3-hydroxy acid dehydrogenase/malonic semialdehyde reductase
MTSLKNKVALITGASSGIGYSCSVKFAEAGAHLIIAARRKDRLLGLGKEVKAKFGTDTLPIEIDVRDRRAVATIMDRLPEQWKNIEFLVNNAGLGRGLDNLYEGITDDWEEMIDTNIKGLLYITRAVLPGMVARKKGTIINLGSISGHEVYPKGNVYCATKHAVDALTKGMRLDLVDSPVRVCSVDPGLVETEFSVVRFHGDADRARAAYENFTPLTADDVADVILFCATRPQHVTLADVIVLPTHQASATLMYRAPKS